MVVQYHFLDTFVASANISQTHEIIHDSIRKTERKNIAETCFDNVKHFLVLYILHKKHVNIKLMKSLN